MNDQKTRLPRFPHPFSLTHSLSLSLTIHLLDLSSERESLADARNPSLQEGDASRGLPSCPSARKQLCS